ncbi:MAG TPA: hypothetical protein VIK94_03265 [Bacilli bacterium]
MKGNKKLFESIIFLCLTILLLITSTFAWFTFNQYADTNDIVVPVGNYNVNIEIEIKKNDDDFLLIKSLENMQNILNNAVPNDIYQFKIKLQNKSNTRIYSILKMEEIKSMNCELDIRDVFYIVDGEVIVNGEVQKLEPKSNDEVTIVNQKVNLYRFNNLIDSYNDITLINNIPLEINEEATIEFKIKYDEETSHIGYQNGIFQIKGFFIYFNI